jgi:hypothetical protein
MGPDFAQLGAAWSKRSNEGRDYLSVKLDDPSFNAPIYTNLFDGDGEGFTFICRKSNADSATRRQASPGQTGRGIFAERRRQPAKGAGAPSPRRIGEEIAGPDPRVYFRYPSAAHQYFNRP